MADKNPLTLTPMEKQYRELKAAHQDKILFFRLGDFYEMFYEDAKLAANILNLTLTARKGMPMAGFPHHSAKQYIKKLIDAGQKVAVCEQLEDPSQAKGIVKRGVVKIFTPGTLLEESLIEDQSNNFLCSIAGTRHHLVLSFVDISTGEFFVSGGNEGNVYRLLQDELAKFQPAEILYEEDLKQEALIFKKILQSGALLEARKTSYFKSLSDGIPIDEIEVESAIRSDPVRLKSMTGALNYLFETQLTLIRNIRKVRLLAARRFVELDDFTLRNLELLKNLRDGSRKYTLFSVLNRTRTAMGSRLLKRRITMPSLDIQEILDRQAKTLVFFDDGIFAVSIQEILKEIGDIERLATRVVLKKAVPRDLVQLAQSLEKSAYLKESLRSYSAFKDVVEAFPDLSAVSSRLKRELNDEPSNLFNGEVIREGVHSELDELRYLRSEGKRIILKIQEEERRKTGIHSLKIKYNKVFGYFIEVSKANLESVPDHYLRKQSLVNAERFTIPELSEYEARINGASEKIRVLEKQLFDELLDFTADFISELQSTAELIAEIDVACGLGVLAAEKNYVRPLIDESRDFEIIDGRHPVVEEAVGRNFFVANDTVMNDRDRRILIVTGPNMAGKSTYLRQNALIAVMAQIGSFVPASRAHIGLIDKIFTRIGASDNLSAGQSTFLVEMEEAANILHHCTDRSLIIMDELGRGTSTYDGLAIAWAVVEWLQSHPHQGGKTLFATHYHELTALSDREGVENLNVAVKEKDDELIFLRRVLPGPADQSYGIHVAHLAGLPQEIIQRARVILKNLETEARAVQEKIESEEDASVHREKELELFPEYREQSVIDQIRRLDPNRISPLEALNLLFDWKERVSRKRS